MGRLFLARPAHDLHRLPRRQQSIHPRRADPNPLLPPAHPQPMKFAAIQASRPNTLGICTLTIPGPLSRTVTSKPRRIGNRWRHRLRHIPLRRSQSAPAEFRLFLSFFFPLSYLFRAVAGASTPHSIASIVTQTSGRICASSHASSELSTASLTVVSNALRGLSKPSRCRFLAKNSLTAMSFCSRHRLGGLFF